jgi:hypothetical protein
MSEIRIVLHCALLRVPGQCCVAKSVVVEVRET